MGRVDIPEEIENRNLKSGIVQVGTANFQKAINQHASILQQTSQDKCWVRFQEENEKAEFEQQVATTDIENKRIVQSILNEGESVCSCDTGVPDQVSLKIE